MLRVPEAHEPARKQGVTASETGCSAQYGSRFSQKAIMNCVSRTVASFASIKVSAMCPGVGFFLAEVPVICKGLPERLGVASKWDVGAFQ